MWLGHCCWCGRGLSVTVCTTIYTDIRSFVVSADGSRPVSATSTELDGAAELDDDYEADMEAMDDEQSSSSTGLAIGITLAVMAAVACTAAILYRRKRRGKKSSYITFGNPSYSREHLPANDFSLDSPLTLSSNGYTVLA